MSEVNRYVRPLSAQAACAALHANPNAKLVAGGQSLLPTLRLGLALFDEIIDLQGLAPYLNQIERHAEPQHETLTMGAMATHAQINTSATVQAFCPMLSQLAGGIGDQQVRNMGTLGGSIANHDPAACWPAGLLACGGVVNISTPTQTRQVNIDDFFTGLFSTALAPDEMVLSVRFNKPLAATYLKFEQPASRFALVGVAVAQHAQHFRVAITGLGHGAIRWRDAEQALTDAFQSCSTARSSTRSTARSTTHSGNLATPLVEALTPLHLDPELASTDLHASAEYRVHMAKVLCQRAVGQHLSGAM